MTARLAVTALCAVLALGGLGTAFVALGDDGDDDARQQPIELRKDDGGSAEIAHEEPDPGDGDDTKGDDNTAGGNNTGDGDRTRGNDKTSGGNNTGDGDGTRGNDGSSGGNNTGDGDATVGNDGSGGGDNSYVAPAASAPAPAPAYGGGGDDSGGGSAT
jgi:hypothetical protein